MSLSKAKEGIRELASRIFPVQKFQHKVFQMQLLTYRLFLSTTEPFRENSGTGPNDFHANRCHALIFEVTAKAHLPHL